jgi:hypothetical protein
MNSTNTERLNLPTPELLRVEGCDGVINFCARWQTAVESVSGYASPELASPISEFLLTSTHRSDNDDRNFYLVRTSYLPVSA